MHTAGVRDCGACLCFPAIEYFNRRHYDTQRDALRPIEDSKLLFAPGTGFSYTSLGYNLSGAVIEGVTGQRFAEFLATQEFMPLGMNSCRADSGTPIEPEARFYEVSLKGYKPVFRVDNTNKLPSGGILAAPSDLVRLGHQMMQPTFRIQLGARSGWVVGSDAAPDKGQGWIEPAGPFGFSRNRSADTPGAIDDPLSETHARQPGSTVAC